MKTVATLILLGIETLAQARNTNDGTKITVPVYVLRSVEDSNLNVAWAQTIAASIFSEAGIEIKWPLGEPGRRKQDIPIVINITSDTPKTLVPGALACAQVFEGAHIRIFWDRVRSTVRGANPLSTFLLAHVMAHEITHIMQGIDRHSEVGVMKASWTRTEIEQMAVKLLPFAPEDVQLIQKGLLKRAARQVDGHLTCG
jgi:hypothetical protein